MNIYVANIPFSVSEEELRELFENYGRVESVRIILDRETQKSRGFAFVEMSNDEDGQSAIDSLNGKNLSGKLLSVSIARPRESGSSQHKKSRDSRETTPPLIPQSGVPLPLEDIENKGKKPVKKVKIEKSKDRFDSDRKIRKNVKNDRKYRRFGDDEDYQFKLGKN